MLPVGSADVDLAGGHVHYHPGGGPERATGLVGGDPGQRVSDEASRTADEPERLPVLYQALSTTVVMLAPLLHPRAFAQLTVGDKITVCDAACFKKTQMMPAVSVPRVVVNASSAYAADSAVCFSHNVL